MAQIQWGQRDPRYSSVQLGSCPGVTIGSAGCYVCAYANIACHFGKPTDPATLNYAFLHQNLYFNGCLCSDTMLQKVYEDIRWVETRHYENKPADFSWLVNTWEDEYVIEVDANLATPGIQTHFMRFWSYLGGKLLVLDSWTGQITDVAKVYGDPKVSVVKIVHYKGPAKPAAAIAEVASVAVAPTIPEPHEIVSIPSLPEVKEAPVVPVEAPKPTQDTPTTPQEEVNTPMFGLDPKSDLFKSLRAAVYSGVSSAIAFLTASQVLNGGVELDKTFLIGLGTAFVNGVLVYLKQKYF